MTRGLGFVWSDAISDETAAAFAAHEHRIHGQLPGIEVRHHGGTALPGMLTTGDVDIHVRVVRPSFQDARDALCRVYEPLFREEWDSDVAYFLEPGAQPAVEIVLTVIGSSDDQYHYSAWQQLAADPELRERYNALKRDHEAGSAEDYKSAKREFFRDIVLGLSAGSQVPTS